MEQWFIAMLGSLVSMAQFTCLRKDKPEKMNETEEENLRQAKSQLEASANHLMVLYASEQSENGSDGTIR